jgi:hypothetical protein
VIQVPEGSERCSHELHAEGVGTMAVSEIKQGKDSVAAQWTPDGKTHGITQAAAGYSVLAGHSQGIRKARPFTTCGRAGRRGTAATGVSAEEAGAASPSPLGCGAAPAVCLRCRRINRTGCPTESRQERGREGERGPRGRFVNGLGNACAHP